MAVHRRSNWTPDEDRRLLDLVKEKIVGVDFGEPQATGENR
jgi:hypothetical protein